MARRVRAASGELSRAGSATKDKALLAIAEDIQSTMDAVKTETFRDVQNAITKGN